MFEDEGFPAVATSSAGMLVSLGYPDGEGIPLVEFVAAVKRIAHAIQVPLGVNTIGGFDDNPEGVAKNVRAVIEAGAIGINIEDFRRDSRELLPVKKQLARPKSLVSLRDREDIHFVINARTEALRFFRGSEEEKMNESIGRALAYRNAGVDCVYPMGLVDAISISRFVKAVDFLTNVIGQKGAPPVSELKCLGISRVSFGPSAPYAVMGLLKRASREVRERGTYAGLLEGALTFDELNGLAVPRREPRPLRPALAQ